MTIKVDTTGLNQVANLLGLNDWELQTAKFAGVSFFIVPNSWEKLNPFEPEFQIANQIFNNDDPNKNLSPNTHLTLSDMKDMQSRKLAVYQLPNQDGFVINDQGTNGITYDGTGLIVGDDYLNAINNLRNTYNKQSTVGYEFIHPIYGIINNCYFAVFNVVYNHTKWRAVAFNFKIIQSGILNPKINKLSTTQIISQILNDINASINALDRISTDILLANSIINNLSNTFSNQTNRENSDNKISSAVSQNIKKTSQILLAGTSLIYQQQLKNQVSNYTFANNEIDYNNLPYLYRYTDIKTTQFESLLQYYSDQISYTISIYKETGLDTYFNNDILVLISSLNQLDNLFKTILNQIEQVYTVYKIPYKMSYRTLFYLNNLDFNNAELVKLFIDMNIDQLDDINIIRTDSTILLPKGT